MAQAFLGEIKIFAGNFAPLHWSFCDGTLFPTSQNQALFSLLGTIYGGDGRTSYGLPDLRGRIPLHFGTGPGLTPRPIGQRAGLETHTLTTDNLPAHSHGFQVNSSAASSDIPSGRVVAKSDNPIFNQDASAGIDTLNDNTVGNAGQGLEYDIHMPWLAVNFIICLAGVYPPRN